MKKIISLILLLALMSNLVLPVAAEAIDAAEPIVIQNGTVEYRVNRQNGRFTVHTEDGIPNKGSDNDKNLLFLGKEKLPDTSYTTFRIDGKDYIFGNSYGMFGSDGGIVGDTVVDGKQTRTVWKIGNITVTQKLFLIVDESNPNIGNTKITYEVSNAGEAPVEVGSRILLDTQLGNNDASAMVVGTQYETNERVFEGEDVPVFWKSSEKQFAPDVVSYGILSGYDNIKPDKLAIGHWQSLKKSKWDFAPNDKLNFTSDKNDYGSADSAAAVYFYPRTLENGKELAFETFYGIGSTSDSYSDAALNVQINSPAKLTVNDEGTAYNEQEFNVTVSLDNNIEGGATLENINITIGMSDELTLADGEVQTKFIDRLQYGETSNIDFRLKASICEKLAVAEYGITVKHDDGSVEASKYIVLPSVKGTPPKMQMNEISPKVMYKDTNKKKLVIKGSDFASLKADSEWTMQIKSDFVSYDIMRKDIQIEDDTLTINIDKDFVFDAGMYQVVLNSKAYGNLSKKIEMSNDSRYDRKEYGIMLIGDFGEDDGRYSVKMLPSERDVEALPESTRENILLTLKGEVYSYEINGTQYYDCDPGTIINNSIKYTPPQNKPKQAMTIRRYDGSKDSFPLFTTTATDALVLTGSGTLSIADYSFHNGDFYIILDDENDYELTPLHGSISEDASNVEIITPANQIINGLFSGISLALGLNITISNAVIGTETVSLGGSVSLETPSWMGGGEDDVQTGGSTGGSGGSTGSGTGGGTGGTGGDTQSSVTPEQKQLQEKFDKNQDIQSGFNANLQDDAIIKLNLEEMRYGISDNSSYLVGLKANGGINLTNDAIPMLNAGGAKLGFSINSLDYPGMYAAINGGFKIGEAFEAEATVAVVIETGKTYLDSVELVMGGAVMRIPLGGVGFLTKLGGGISGLYATTKGNYTYIPPIMLKLISGYADPTMFSFQLGTIAAEFGPRGFEFTAGEGKIVGINIIESAYAKFLMYENDNKDLCMDLGAGISVNLLDILIGEASAWLIYDPQIDGIFGPVSLGGKAFVGVFLPKWIPLLGGMELLSVMAELSTRRMFLGVRIIGIPISVGYYWDSGEVKFFDTFSATVDENGNYMIPPEEYENALDIEYTNQNGVNSAVVYGGNLRKTYSSKNRVALMSETDNLTHTVPVSEQEYGLFELTYSGDAPEITLTQPNGTNYELIENVNYITQTISRENTQSGEEEKKVFISVQNPQDGNWIITTSKPVECDAMDVLPLPELKNVTCEKIANDKVKVDWEALNINDAYTVDIHASKAQDAEATLQSDEITSENATEANKEMADNYDVGIRLANDIKASDNYAIVDLSDRLLDGDYQIRVVLKRGDENFSSELSAESFTYNNPQTPDTPSNVSVSLGGDGLFNVSYDAVEGADGYYVEVVDENGNSLEGVAPVSTKDTKTYIGGMYEVADTYDENDNPLTFKKVGVQPGSKYKVKVSAFTEEKSIKYESVAYVSESMMLPVPNPANIEIKVNNSLATDDESQNPNNKKALINTQNAEITLTPDQNIEMAYMVNSEFQSYDILSLNANEPYNLSVPLNEGENLVSVFAKNEANDYTSANITINVDTVKPELMLNNTTVMSEDGQYEIVGTAESNATVYINDSTTPMAMPDGVFTYHGTQQNTHDNVKITAIDTAGNENTVNITVIPSELSSFKKMFAKEELADGYVELTNEKTLKKGDKLKLAMFGLDSENREYSIDQSEVIYSIVAGNGVCSVTEDGVVEALYPGEAVVMCEYYPTEDYSFEETVTVNVEDTFRQAEDIRISTTDIFSSVNIGCEAARFSIPNSPIGISYDYGISDNEYFEIVGNKLIAKKPIDFNSFDIEVTAKGKHIINGAYQEIGNPVTKSFTIRTIKAILSVDTLDSINAFLKTDFENAGLPNTITVELDTGEKVECGVTWQKGAFNSNVAGTYTIKGYLTLNDNIVNINDVNAILQLCIKYLTDNYDVIHNSTYTHFIVGDLSGNVKLGDSTLYYDEQDGKYHIILKGNYQAVNLLKDLSLEASEPEKLIKGDTNNDGKINIIDAQRIIPYYLDGIEPTDPNEYLRGDMNGDWEFDILDAQRIIFIQ